MDAIGAIHSVSTQNIPPPAINKIAQNQPPPVASFPSTPPTPLTTPGVTALSSTQGLNAPPPLANIINQTLTPAVGAPVLVIPNPPPGVVLPASQQVQSPPPSSTLAPQPSLNIAAGNSLLYVPPSDAPTVPQNVAISAFQRVQTGQQQPPAVTSLASLPSANNPIALSSNIIQLSLIQAGITPGTTPQNAQAPQAQQSGNQVNPTPSTAPVNAPTLVGNRQPVNDTIVPPPQTDQPGETPNLTGVAPPPVIPQTALPLALRQYRQVGEIPQMPAPFQIDMAA